MARVTKVGEIQGYDILYIPERDVIFCKNTAVSLSTLDKVINSNYNIEQIPEKNLTISKDDNIITLGCLTTTRDYYKEVKHNINKLKRTKK